MPHSTDNAPRSGSRTAAVWAGLAVAAALVVFTPRAAQAHAVLVSSSPCDGEVVASVPTGVAFRFDEAVSAPAFVSVVGPDDTNIAEGDPVIKGDTVTQAVRLLPGQGRYSASYRVVSDDGHPVTGTIHFTVDPANVTGSPTSMTPAACTSDSYGVATSTAFWHRESTWIVLAIALLAAVIALVFGLGLRSGATTHSEPGGRG
jgi:methionine-rich copper-binding protein CopC